MGTHTYLLKKPDRELGKPLSRDSKYLVNIIGKNWATIVVWVAVLSCTWKVFRCGGRGNLTMVGWVWEHTIFGSPVQYVPEEEYARELEGTYLQDGELRW